MRDRRLRHRGDRGTVLIIVAVFSVVAVLMLAFVVDLGNQRGEGKQVTLSTDSAALAAAASIDFTGQAAGSKACSDVPSTDKRWGNTIHHVAAHYLSVNGSASAPTCQVVFDSPTSAFVTVSVRKDVGYQIASGLGQAGSSVAGSSSARAAKGAAGGLYPVGLCTPAAVSLLGGADDMTFDPPEDVDVGFTNAACGGSGNKRQVQFKPGLTGNQCGQVGMWCYDFNHGGFKGVPARVESDTGKDWQKAETVISELILAGTHIWIPVIGNEGGVDDNGRKGGTKFTYDVTHFAEVVIKTYSKQDGMTFDLYRLVEYTPDGPPATMDNRSVDAHLCATGQGTSACDPKPTSGSGGGDAGDIDLTPVGCVVEDVSPRSQAVNVDANGTPAQPRTYVITVNSADDCSGLSAAAVNGGTTVPADVSLAAAPDTFNADFPNSKNFGAVSRTFTIEIRHAGAVEDASASLTVTAPAPTCTASGSATPPTQLVVKKSNNSQLRDGFTVTVSVGAAAPCTALSGRLAFGATYINFSSVTISGNTITATMNKNTSGFTHNRTYDVQIFGGSPSKLVSGTAKVTAKNG